MALSPMIEFLQTLQRPGGGNICHVGAFQIIVPALPPGGRIIFDMIPQLNLYAYIIYMMGLAAMVPAAFTKTYHQYAAPVFSATITQNQILMDAGIGLFEIATRVEPARFELDNVSNLSQYYEAYLMFLTVDNEDDLRMIRDAMRHYGNLHTHTEGDVIKW